MKVTTLVHVRQDTIIDSQAGSNIPSIRLAAADGSSEVVLHFYDDSAIEALRVIVGEFAHETPFHLRYRAGCQACERAVARIANRVALTEELERRAEAKS